MYKTPDNYFYRLHHIRPRFKDNVESVLIFMANKLAQIDTMPSIKFKSAFNAEIMLFPGNSSKAEKTINNWRTEISALFGFVVEDNGVSSPGRRAIELAEKQDLIEFFKIFLYNFQYPGAHLKPHEIVNMVKRGIKFRPCQYILKLFSEAEHLPSKDRYLSKAEVCHMIFNDLRCTRDCEEPGAVWERILFNRKNNVVYDWSGDVVRYAGDVLDYMEISNLVNTYNGYNFWINKREKIAIQKFIKDDDSFKGYDIHIDSRIITINEARLITNSWFKYVNRSMDHLSFSTDVLAFISKDKKQYDEMRHHALSLFDQKLNTNNISTKEIGDLGESLAHEHECNRILKAGRKDLIHLIQLIPTQFAVGYDLQSIELNEQKRLIEVKSTVSSKPIMFNSFHLTPNEWRSAESFRDRYFIYRLMLSKGEKRLYIIQDPVGKYKSDLVSMIPKNDGADICFDDKIAGCYEELLLNGKI